MLDPAKIRKPIRLRGRSYFAFVLSPETPIFQWLEELNYTISQSPNYFAEKPVILDLSAVTLSNSAILHLLSELRTRNIRILGLEGLQQSVVGLDLPPVLSGGRDTKLNEPAQGQGETSCSQQESASLLLENPVRSGQVVVFPQGDVTVLGSVGSGAEIIAGGSIHVYGTLRGRALAGSTGNARARIFCNKVEAELLAIDGSYRTAEDIDETLRSQPIQAWLEGDVMFIAPLH
jgi:septum site-determining protein MinC